MNLVIGARKENQALKVKKGQLGLSGRRGRPELKGLRVREEKPVPKAILVIVAQPVSPVLLGPWANQGRQGLKALSESEGSKVIRGPSVPGGQLERLDPKVIQV